MNDRDAQIVAWANEGVTFEAISRRIGMKHSSVRSVVSRLRRKGVQIDRKQGPSIPGYAIPSVALQTRARAAFDRNERPADVARATGLNPATVRSWYRQFRTEIRRDVPVHTHQASAGACGKATWNPAIPAAALSVAGKPSAGNASSAVPLPRRG